MSGARIHLALLDPTGSSLLWREIEGGLALPCVDSDIQYAADVEEARSALAARGFAVTFLRTVLYLPGGDGARSDIVQLAEPDTSDLPDGHRWGPCPPLEQFASGPPERRAEMHAALQRTLEHEVDPPMLRPPWARRGWRREAEAWVATELECRGRPRTGPMMQIKQWSITSLWRVPTARGDCYFKTAPPLPLFADEGGIIGALEHLFPERVPRLLAHDPERHWMLLDAFSGSEVNDVDAASRRRVARAFATLQVEAVSRRDDLLAAGAVDRRYDSFERAIDRLLNEAEERTLLSASERERLPELRPKLAAILAELRGFGVPETLVHGDLHFGNVVLQEDGRALFYDWTDAAIAHPFVDLVTLLGHPDDPSADSLSALKLAYLEPWLTYESLPRLWRACELGILLGYAYHAISYQAIREGTETDARWELEGMTAWGLRRLLERL